MTGRTARALTASLALLASTTPSGFAHPPNRSPADVIADAVAELGGPEAIRGVRTLRQQYVQEAANKGQEEWPGAPMPWFTPNDVIDVMDPAHEAIWTQNAPPRPTRPYLTWVIRGDHGILRQDTSIVGGTSTVVSVPAKRRMRLEPVFLMQRVLDADPAAFRQLRPRELRGRRAEGVEARLGPDTVQLWFDARHHLLSAVSRTEDDPIRGPVEMLTEYANWTRTGKVMFPFTIHRSENAVLVNVNTVRTVEVNPPGIDSLFAVPERWRIRDLPLSLSFDELAPGVFRLQYYTHTPMVVVQGDSLVLLEAPVSDAFTRMVLDSLRARFPDKRVGAFVVTHHHWDHTGGVRAAFAAGLRALVQEENAEFVRTVGGPRSTSPASRAITVVRDSLVVGAGPTRFILYHIPTGHVRGLLMAYFPETRTMFEVDLAQGPPNDRQDFYDFVVARGLQVDRLARIHGLVPMTWEAFVKTVPVPRPPS